MANTGGSQAALDEMLHCVAHAVQDDGTDSKAICYLSQYGLLKKCFSTKSRCSGGFARLAKLDAT
jgi:hypothetical protein